MFTDLFISQLLPAILSLLAAVSTAGILEALKKNLGRAPKDAQAERKPYSERLADLTGSLRRASQEVDQVLAELAQVAKERAEAVKRLEVDLQSMEGQEKELKARIELLQATPIAVAEHFAKLVEPGERRSAKRDYILFGAGVLVSTLIGVVIQLFLK